MKHLYNDRHGIRPSMDMSTYWHWDVEYDQPSQHSKAQDVASLFHHPPATSARKNQQNVTRKGNQSLTKQTFFEHI